MKRVEIKQALQMQASENEITVMGWVRTKRGSKNVAFIALNDGTTINNLQLVIDLNAISEDKLALMHAGASLWAKGHLVASMGSGQAVELAVKEIGLFGPANPDEYPLQPKKHSLEFLRDIAHLRFRTNTFGAIMPWYLPSTSFSTTAALSTCTRHSSRLRTVKVPARCSK